MAKKTIDDWNSLTSAEKKKLPPEELEELFQAYDEWYKKEAPRQEREVEESLERYLAKFADIDVLLSQKSSMVDILFLCQNKYPDKTNFIEHLKKELKFYVSYFDPELNEDVFDSMYDRIADIEERYKYLLGGLNEE